MKTTPKDFFLHLGAVIGLYSSVAALINLGFAIVNRLLPDALDTFWSSGSIVWPVSVLIIMVPALYVIEWFIFRDIAKMPEKKEIWVRRWRIYTTLFLTALAMVVDLIVLLNVFLNGEITGRFVWKVLIVFGVTALVFVYYILARIGLLSGPIKVWRLVLAWVGAALVVAAIVGGFVIIGSPAKQRALRFDEQRIADLTNIQYEVSSYVQNQGKLPQSLSDLNSTADNFMVPTDPQTNAQYQYTTEGTSTYQLCATFNLSSKDDPEMDSLSANVPGWDHSAGVACFTKQVAVDSDYEN